MSKPVVGPIESGSIRLRLLEESDLEMTLGWRNRDDIRKWFFTDKVLTFEQHHNWFLEKYLPRADDVIFVIESKIYDMPVGQISLYNIDLENLRGEYGRLMIGEPVARHKGFARAATHLILQFAFETIGLDEVYLSVIHDNQHAINLYRSCDFLFDWQDGEMVRMSIRNPKGKEQN